MGEQAREQAERDVDEEDRAPAPSENVGVDEEAADHRTEDGGDTGDGPVDAEDQSVAPLVEQGRDESQGLRGHERRTHALYSATGDEFSRTGRHTAQHRRHGEGHHPDHEHPPASDTRPQCRCGQQGARERQGVHRQHEELLRRRRAEIPREIGQSDVDDGGVQHLHEHPEQASRKSRPGPRTIAQSARRLPARRGAGGHGARAGSEGR